MLSAPLRRPGFASGLHTRGAPARSRCCAPDRRATSNARNRGAVHPLQWVLRMLFVLFSSAISAAFFATSLFLLNAGRQRGLRYLQQNGAATITGLGIIESAVFALIGLLVAFTVSGALQRFDERRQLVIQEANAISTAYDRLALLEGDTARNLQRTLRDYARARIELYRMPLEFSVWDGTEVWSRAQYEKIRALKDSVWHETVTACATARFPPNAR